MDSRVKFCDLVVLFLFNTSFAWFFYFGLTDCTINRYICYNLVFINAFTKWVLQPFPPLFITYHLFFGNDSMKLIQGISGLTIFQRILLCIVFFNYFFFDHYDRFVYFRHENPTTIPYHWSILFDLRQRWCRLYFKSFSTDEIVSRCGRCRRSASGRRGAKANG